MLIRVHSVGGIMVSIAAFQAVDPGSIPGRRIFSHFESNVKSVSQNFPPVSVTGPTWSNG